MSITLDDVSTFVLEWFHTVGRGGSGDEQAQFHKHRDARVYTGSGDSFTLDEHHDLHQQWTNEKHILGPLELAQITDNPNRVRVSGTVYWEAHQKGQPQNEGIIKMIVGESWIIERTDAGLKFLLYVSTTFHPLPDSTPLEL